MSGRDAILLAELARELGAAVKKAHEAGLDSDVLASSIIGWAIPYAVARGWKQEDLIEAFDTARAIMKSRAQKGRKQ